MTDPLHDLAHDREYRRRTIEELQEDLDHAVERTIQIGEAFMVGGVGGRPVDRAGVPLVPAPPTLLDMARAAIHAAALDNAIAELQAP
jgi:hypothetical protein